MEGKKYICWQDDDIRLGYLEEYPDYMTQGKTIEELKENLRDIYIELNSGNIPGVRRKARKKSMRDIGLSRESHEHTDHRTC